MPRGMFLGDRIPFWNRREIYVGSSLEDFNRVRNVLDERKIKYAYREINMGGWDFNRKFMWYVYVHKNYEEEAAFLVRR